MAFSDREDKEELENWVRNHGAREAYTADALFDSACERLRSLRVEFPAEGELERVINTALNGFFQTFTGGSLTHLKQRSKLVSIPYSSCPSRRLFQVLRN